MANEERISRNDYISFAGHIMDTPEFNHEVHAEKFYRTRIAVNRLSGTQDELPLIFSERVINPSELEGNVLLKGQLRSVNIHKEDGRSHLKLFAFVQEVEKTEEITGECVNQVYLLGHICRKPVYRMTPLGREVSDLLIAVNRPFGKSDYIPCIVWGRNAKAVADMAVGTALDITGRMQSRHYAKKLEDGTKEDRVAYEVSVTSVDIHTLE